MIDDSACVVWRMGGLARDGTAKLISRNQILRRERGHIMGEFLSLQSMFPPKSFDSFSLKVDAQKV